MVILEGNSGETIKITEEEEKTSDNDIKVPRIFSVEILRIIRDAQQQHGLRHGDYQRYRGYCSRRLRRLRKVLKMPQGDRRHYRRRDVTAVHLSATNADPRLLRVPLMLAERAWAHAMQLRQEANTEPRKRFHLVARMRKACGHAITLLDLCESGCSDARTQLEAQAYSAWMHGSLHFELQLWKPAAENLQKSQMVYEKLAATLPEEEQTVYRQKVDELKPSLRYCAYNIGDKSAANDLLSMRGQGFIDNLDTLMAQARDARSGVMHEIEWRGKKTNVRPERVRLFLISLQDLDKSINKAQTDQAKIDLLENILMDCKDAITAIKDEIKADPKLKNAPGAPISGIQLLLSYLLHLRLVRTIERNNLLVKTAEEAWQNKTPLDGKKVRPQDLTRLYEIILQNFTELQQLPGFESDADYQDEIETQSKAYKAFRCYYIAQVLTMLRRWREALALLERSTLYAKEYISAKLQDKWLVEKLQVLLKLIESCKYEVHANSVLADDDDGNEDSYVSSGRNYRDKKPLCERLDEYREEPQALTKHPNVYKLPPNMEAIPCKPLFFDLACNYIEFPTLDDKIGASEKKQGGGLTGMVKGLLGWGKGGK